MTTESFLGKLLPVHQAWTSRSQITKTIIFWLIAGSIGFSSLMILANRSITFLGLTTNESGVVQPGLLVVLFADGIEVARTASFESSWDGNIPAKQEINRGSNFILNSPNYFGYKPNPFELTSFIAANKLKVDQPKYYVSPNNNNLTLLSIDPTRSDINVSKPLRLNDDGTLSEIAMSNPIYEEQERLTILKESNQNKNIKWLQSIGIFAAVVIGITTNIIASYLQTEYKLIDDNDRFAIVILVFICALILSILSQSKFT